MEQAKYDVFISYSRKDYVDAQKNVIPGNAVTTIKEALTKEGITYWFDEEGISYGDNFTEKIVTNIEAARIFVYLSTANANSSPWTSKEIACADEMHKYIIPVRIDRTPYNKKVMFRIADLSYIDYFQNTQKGISDLVASIKTYLERIQLEEKKKQEEEAKKREAERKKAEEEKKKRELEERRRIEEQKRIVSDIKILCKKLNNDEEKILLERENLLLSTQRVADINSQTELKTLIIDSSPMRQKQQAKYQELEEKIKGLQDGVNSLTAEKEVLLAHEAALTTRTSELTACKQELEQVSQERTSLSKKITDLEAKLKSVKEKDRGNSSRKERLLYASIIGLLLVTTLFFVIRFQRQASYWKNQVELVAADSLGRQHQVTEKKISGTFDNSVLGKYSYEGTVDGDGQPNGKGKAVFANGNTYEGQFIHGTIQGEAIYTFANGDVFDGLFKNNMFNVGIYSVKEDSTYFIGTFNDGEPKQGTWYNKKGTIIIKK